MTKSLHHKQKNLLHPTGSWQFLHVICRYVTREVKNRGENRKLAPVPLFVALLRLHVQGRDLSVKVTLCPHSTFSSFLETKINIVV